MHLFHTIPEHINMGWTGVRSSLVCSACVHDLQPHRGDDDAAPGVEQLRQEVAVLRRDMDTIRSTMQDMHREVGVFKKVFRCGVDARRKILYSDLGLYS